MVLISSYSSSLESVQPVQQHWVVFRTADGLNSKYARINMCLCSHQPPGTLIPRRYETEPVRGRMIAVVLLRAGSAVARALPPASSSSFLLYPCATLAMNPSKRIFFNAREPHP